MKPVIPVPACLLLLVFCFPRCGQRENPHRIYTDADSLLELTMELQSRISSPEIQRLQEFQELINQDLELIESFPEENPSLVRYRELSIGLGQCMQACNQFHEEAFMLESSLREIMDLSHLKDADLKSLESRLQFESENLKDLSQRIDSSIRLALRQAETFYSLKPEIDQIKQQYTPDPIP